MSSNDGIDHVAEARRLQRLARATMEGAPLPVHMLAVIQLDEARLEAQLALVEQQRIANLIALHVSDLEVKIGGRSVPYPGLGMRTQRRGEWTLRPEIVAALGIDYGLGGADE